MENTETGNSNLFKDKKSMKLLWTLNAVLLLAISAAVFGLWFSHKNEKSDLGYKSGGSVLGASTKDPNYLIGLTDSLKQSGFVLYGDSKESQTKKQLSDFGQAVDYLDYVECDSQIKGSNPEECLAKGIEEYPTWVHGADKIPGYLTSQEIEKMLSKYAFE
ncbi:MAG: hypothetical protein WC451_05955 [Patescibacteria group bacterium]